MKNLLAFSLMAGIATAAIGQSTETPAALGPTTGPVAGAQSPTQLPPGPLFKPMPDQTVWTITRKGGESGSPQSEAKSDSGATAESGEAQNGKPENGKPENVVRSDVQIVGVKMGDLSHVVTTLGNGFKKEVWAKGGMQTMICTGWKEPLVTRSSEESEDLSWVSSTNFIGIRKASGRDCMFFRDRILPPLYRQHPEMLKKSTPKTSQEAADNAKIIAVLKLKDEEINPEQLKINALACIDLETRLPIALQIGKATTSFKYQPVPPNFTLSLPPEIQAVLDARIQQVVSTSRKPVLP